MVGRALAAAHKGAPSHPERPSRCGRCSDARCAAAGPGDRSVAQDSAQCPARDGRARSGTAGCGASPPDGVHLRRIHVRALRAQPALRCPRPRPRPGLCGARHGRQQRGGPGDRGRHEQHRGPGYCGSSPCCCSQACVRGHPHRPPGNVVFTFVAASCAFFPQHFADIPGHLALTLAAGLLAWLVCMAPRLVRSQEPQRLAVARALTAAVQLARTPDDDPAHAPACRAAAAAAAEAWRTVSLIRVRSPERQTLALPLARTESDSAAPPRELVRWARLLPGTAPLPDLLPPHPAGEVRDALGAPEIAQVRSRAGRAGAGWRSPVLRCVTGRTCTVGGRPVDR